MIKKNQQKVLKTKIYNLILLKYEIKNIILKSIIHNQNINNKYKLYTIFLQKKKVKPNKKICLLSGNHRSSNTYLNLSKHNLNYLTKLGLLQNYKINSW